MGPCPWIVQVPRRRRPIHSFESICETTALGSPLIENAEEYAKSTVFGSLILASEIHSDPLRVSTWMRPPPPLRPSLPARQRLPSQSASRYSVPFQLTVARPSRPVLRLANGMSTQWRPLKVPCSSHSS